MTGLSAVERVRAAYARIDAVDRPEVWITLRPPEHALADAATIDARVGAGEALPLAGRTVAIKDNIDVAGLPTTAGCPAFAYDPPRTAPAAARLLEGGAVLLGKTNLDQFATGLVGTRSPYGAVRDAHRPAYVSGGSSSGSAVAVALGIADITLGTDTAGSGRVPAAFGGIVGVKPTRGLLPLTGVVPACRSLDVVSTLARTLAEATLAAGIAAGRDPADPLGRDWPADAPPGAPPVPRIGIPRADELSVLTPEAQAAFAAAASALQASGADVRQVDIEPILRAGELLYGGAFVAERYTAVGPFVDAHREDVDPAVGGIISAARNWSAHELLGHMERLDECRLGTRRLFEGLDALLLPTTLSQPTLAVVAEDPIGQNARLSRFVNGCNLLDLCAVAFPAGAADGGCFGAMLYAPAFHDRVAADVAAQLLGEPPATALGPPDARLLVVGLHLTGQPLNHQLVERRGRRLGSKRTSADYRLHRLATDPPKPGLVRVAVGEGTPIAGELWSLSPAALGDFLAAIPAPMVLGQIALDDGTSAVGFLCEPIALAGAQDISSHGGWASYLRAAARRGDDDRAPAPPPAA